MVCWLRAPQFPQGLWASLVLVPGGGRFTSGSLSANTNLRDGPGRSGQGLVLLLRPPRHGSTPHIVSSVDLVSRLPVWPATAADATGASDWERRPGWSDWTQAWASESLSCDWAAGIGLVTQREHSGSPSGQGQEL